MESIFRNLISGSNGHPSEDDLLLFMDGELAIRASVHVRNHLEACWSCRVRTEKIEETISTFINYRNFVLKPLTEQPPHGWRSFDGQLNRLADEVGRPSLFANVRGVLGRILSAPGLERVSVDSTILLRAATAFIVIAVLTAGLIYLNRAPVVTANELIARAAEAQQHSLSSTSQAVIYQKLQIRRKTNAASDSATCETWSDTVSGRARLSVEQGNTRHFIDVTHTAPHPAGVPAPVSSLAAMLRANHMNPGLPLSADSFEAWRKSLAAHRDEVRQGALNGHDTLTLRTVSQGQTNVGEILEGSLVVRASDWHPIGANLRVKGSTGDEEFELTEMAYAVVSLNTLAPEIFSAQSVAISSLSKLETLNPKPETLDSKPETALSPSATADLEVEVLRVLHDARADLGEQITTKIGPDGLLRVTGIVDTDQRKAELLRALQPVSGNPAVRIEIQTIAEGLAQHQQQRQRAKATPAPVIEQNIESGGETIAAAPELRKHFASEDQVRGFAARMVSQSRSTMRHAYALKRLAGQFSPEELRSLTPEARSKWLVLISSHARAYQNQISAISRELQPIFPAAGVTASSAPAVTDETSVIRAIEQLVSFASTNDAVIRSAFATSSGATVSVINSPQFWRSMKSAEALAARLGTMR